MDAARPVALISGAGRGIGAATARELGRRGYHVIVNYLRRSDTAAEVVTEIEAAGGTAQAVRADVCVADQSGAFFLTQRALAIMKEQRAGRIVYVSSTSADRVMGSIAHSTAKAALNTFSVQVAGEAARYGVTVNTVAAGAILTDATAAVFTGDVRRYRDDRPGDPRRRRLGTAGTATRRVRRPDRRAPEGKRCVVRTPPRWSCRPR